MKTTSKEIHDFQEQGYVILRGVLEPDVIAGAQGEMEKIVDQHAAKLLATGKINDLMESEPFETRIHRLYEQCLDEAPTQFREELHLAPLFDVFFDSQVLDVVESLIGSEIRLYPNYTVRPKLPDWEGTLALWHQDGAYTEDLINEPAGELTTDYLRMVNVWTPLVPANVENGCMQFIPGTHKLGLVPHVEKEYYLEIAEDVLRPRLDQAVDIELNPGDVVLFNNLLFHQGQPNRSKHVRWSLDWRYQDASQSTLRKESGHIARSASNPASAVQNATQWSELTFD